MVSQSFPDLALRIGALAVIGALMLFYDASSNELLMAAVPLLLAACAYVAVRSWLAVAMGTGLLSLAHADFLGSVQQRWLFPALALLSLATVLTIVVQRIAADRGAAKARRGATNTGNGQGKP